MKLPRGRNQAIARSVSVGLGLLSLIALASASFAYPRPGTIARASGITASQKAVKSHSVDSSLNANGSVVAFTTDAALVPVDGNGMTDIYVRDLVRGQTELISISMTGRAGLGIGTTATTGRGWHTGFPEQSMLSWSPAISGNSRYVAFVSRAVDLVPEANGDLLSDVFLFDRKNSTTQRISLETSGKQLECSPAVVSSLADNCMSHPSIDHLGRTVTFTTRAGNLFSPEEVNQLPQVFVRDLKKKTTRTVTIDIEGKSSSCTQVNTPVCALEFPASSLSGDGRFVAFSSASSNLVEGDTNLTTDVFVRDLRKNVTERVSVATDGSQGLDNGARKPFTLQTGSHLSGRDWEYQVGHAISFDGRYVVFSSRAENLVPYDSHRDPVRGDEGNDVFVHDRQTNRTERLSVEADGREVVSEAINYGHAILPSISPDGRYVSFFCRCNMASADSAYVNASSPRITRKVVVVDRLTGQVDPMRAVDRTKVGSHDSSIIEMDPDIARQGRFISYSYNDTTTTFGDAINVRYPTTIYRWDHGRQLHAFATASKTPEASSFASRSLLRPFPDPTDALTDLGSNIVSATVAHRQAYNDLYLKLDLDRLALTQPVVYGFEYTRDGTRFQVRAARMTQRSAELIPAFGLFRCAPSCVEVDRLNGGYGTVGESVVVAVPLGNSRHLDGSIRRVKAFVGLGSYLGGAIVTLDELKLPSLSRDS